MGRGAVGIGVGGVGTGVRIRPEKYRHVNDMEGTQKVASGRGRSALLNSPQLVSFASYT